MRARREDKWILNGKVPEPCPNLLRWAAWIETTNRHVGRTELMGGEVLVSTVFLGINHNWRPDGKPILFETMVFTSDHQDLGQWRYETWEQAEEGHAKVVAMMEQRISEAEDATAKMAKGAKP